MDVKEKLEAGVAPKEAAPPVFDSTYAANPLTQVLMLIKVSSVKPCQRELCR